MNERLVAEMEGYHPMMDITVTPDLEAIEARLEYDDCGVPPQWGLTEALEWLGKAAGEWDGVRLDTSFNLRKAHARILLAYITALRAATQDRDRQAARVGVLEAENARLDALLNTPEIHDFSRAVVLEAAHQREHKDDSWKTDADWYWLIGYLAGKAMWNPCEPEDNAVEKRLHRVITVAAAAANWHADIARRALAAPRAEVE